MDKKQIFKTILKGIRWLIAMKYPKLIEVLEEIINDLKKKQ